MTWHDVLPTVDNAIEDLKLLMNTDPRRGVFYQQRLAVMMRRKQTIQIRIAEEQEDDNGTSNSNKREQQGTNDE